MLLIPALEVYGILHHIGYLESQCEIRLFIKKVSLLIQTSVQSVGLFAILMFPPFLSPLSLKITIKFIFLQLVLVGFLLEDNVNPTHYQFLFPFMLCGKSFNPSHLASF